MNQQINLYQPMFRKQKIIFSAMTMLQVGVFFIVVFVSIYIYQNSQLKPYKKQLASIDNEIIQLGSQVIALKASSKKTKSKLLEIELAKLTKELEQRERIFNVLSNKTFGNSSGFSTYLEAFAKSHIHGTWLTSVDIKEGGAALSLKGKTLSSELVPVYIQNLSEEKTLDGTSFNVMELARVETDEGKSELNFSISTN